MNLTRQLAQAISPIAKATLRSAIIYAGSNVLAQVIQAYQDEVLVSFELDVYTLIHFTLCAFILSPLGYLWLKYQEIWLPEPELPSPDSAKPGISDVESDRQPQTDQSSQKSISDWTRTIAKLILTQLVAGAWQTVLFITTMGVLRGYNWEMIIWQIEEGFWTYMINGLMLWFFVPASERLLPSTPLGVVWTFYLSFATLYENET